MSTRTIMRALCVLAAVSVIGTMSSSRIRPQSAAAPTALYRVDAGGTGVVSDQLWEGDTEVTPSPFLVSGSIVASTNHAIGTTHRSVPDGTPESIFKSERSGRSASARDALRWSFPVPPGNYRVRLYFAEISARAQAAGARVFDVVVENSLVTDNLDVFKRVGGYEALVKSYVVSSDSALTVDLELVTGAPQVKGIEVSPAGAGSTPPPPAPNPEPSPTPDPQPVPDPEPSPTPDPQPVPDPEPSPTPDPQPVPDPEPSPTPDPQPIPDPSTSWQGRYWIGNSGLPSDPTRYDYIVDKGTSDVAPIHAAGARAVNHEPGFALNSEEAAYARSRGWLAKTCAGAEIHPLNIPQVVLMDGTIPAAVEWRTDIFAKQTNEGGFDASLIDTLWAIWPANHYDGEPCNLNEQAWADASVTTVDQLQAKTNKPVLANGRGLSNAKWYYSAQANADRIITAADGIQMEQFARNDPPADAKYLQLLGVRGKLTFAKCHGIAAVCQQAFDAGKTPGLSFLHLP